MTKTERGPEGACDLHPSAPCRLRQRRVGIWIAFGIVLLLFGKAMLVFYERLKVEQTLLLLLDCEGFDGVEMTPARIRQIEPCIPVLIEMHRRAVEETAGLTEDELLAKGGYHQVDERLRSWAALEYAESLSGDQRATRYIERHVRSKNVWWSEWPYPENPNAPEQWSGTGQAGQRE